MFRAGFNPRQELANGSLVLKPLREEDFDRLFAAAADPSIWAGHPAKDRYRKEVFDEYFRALMQRQTAFVVIDRASEVAIGSSAYYQAPDRADSVSIGFTFLRRTSWGGSVNFDLKSLMLDHAFESYEEVWFHIAPTNIRSQKAMAKLGAEHAYDATLDLSGTPSPWMCLRVGRDAWRTTLAKRTRGTTQA